MSVDLYVDGTLLRRDADGSALAVALLALRSREEAELELAGDAHSLVIEKDDHGLHVSLLHDDSGEHLVGVTRWDQIVEAAAEFLSGAPGRPGGLLAVLREPWDYYDDCPACRALKEGRL